MRRRVQYIVAVMVCAMVFAPGWAQRIPVALEYTEIYDFLEELTTDGVIQTNAAIKPYTRDYIAARLHEAQQRDSLLTRRQREDLDFYLQDYALELDTLPDYKLYGHENVCQWRSNNPRTDSVKRASYKCDFNLSLVDPSLHLKTKDDLFKMRVRPILGMDLYAQKKGIITKRWYGADTISILSFIDSFLISHVSYSSPFFFLYSII